MSLERSLIEHCSPTLASLKAGSLFCFPAPADRGLRTQIASINGELRQKGLVLIPVKPQGDRTLCYLCRLSQLGSMLASPQNRDFLRSRGYNPSCARSALATLCRRLREGGTFPHEIGLFLGYPLGDVIGFIENGGKNCLCCGCWKAYTDACAAKRLFARYDKCTCVYRRLYHCGARTLSQLTVAA